MVKIDVQIICATFFYVSCRGRLWFLGPKNKWIKAQRLQYNKFLKNGLKS